MSTNVRLNITEDCRLKTKVVEKQNGKKKKKVKKIVVAFKVEIGL